MTTKILIFNLAYVDEAGADALAQSKPVIDFMVSGLKSAGYLISDPVSGEEAWHIDVKSKGHDRPNRLSVQLVPLGVKGEGSMEFFVVQIRSIIGLLKTLAGVAPPIPSEELCGDVWKIAQSHNVAKLRWIDEVEFKSLY